jgi:predicted  nucleic acid-binding Zn-ribbon protein
MRRPDFVLKAKSYQIQLNKKEAEMTELRSKLEKRLITAKDFESESLRITQAYPLVPATPNK